MTVFFGGGGVDVCSFEQSLDSLPPPAVHGFRHTGSVVYTGLLNSQLSHWLYHTDEILSLKYDEWQLAPLVVHIALGVSPVFANRVSHLSSAVFRIRRLNKPQEIR
jgi:hypothetical protein